MNKDRAVEILKSMTFLTNGYAVEEHAAAIKIAIEAIRTYYVDGCEGCKYMEKDQYEMPCVNCKNSHKNLWCAE